MEAFSDGVIAIIITIMVLELRVPHGISLSAVALGRDFKGKISIAVYGVAIGLAFVRSWLACALYVAVAITWLVPDRRIEKRVTA